MKRSSARVAATGEVVMAYILLALGAVMALVGLAAMITGYPMIEIERGWATVITGAVLLSGGLVVVALGLVVRNLVGLRTALSVSGALPASIESPSLQPIGAAPLIPATSPTLPSLNSPAATRASAASFDLTPELGIAVPAAVAALAAGGSHEHEERAAAHVPEISVHEPTAATHDPEPHWAEPHASEALVPAAYVPEVHTPEPAREQELVHQEPAHQEAVLAQPVEVRGEAEQAKSDRDWLDQAFSAFDYEMTGQHRQAEAPTVASPEPHAETAHEPQLPEPVHKPEPDALHASAASDVTHHAAIHETAVTEPAAHEPEQLASSVEAPSTAPAEPAAELAVIGRYDSEGTSYVMYSDGSIEAQSEAGVYRFGSMAELKAFIEN